MISQSGGVRENAILVTEVRFRQIKELKTGRVGSFLPQH